MSSQPQSTSSSASASTATAPSTPIPTTTTTVNETDAKRILQMCNELYVGLTITADDVIIRKFDNVYASIFQLSFHPTHRPPLPPLVIKFYDPKPNPLFTPTTSQLSNLIIGQSGLGPRIHQIHPDALVMQYLPGRPLTATDDTRLTTRKAIATQLAHFHSLTVPIARNRHQDRVLQLFNTRLDDKLIQSLESGELKRSLEAHGLKNILEHDLPGDAHFVRDSILRDDAHVIVFSHCDFNHGNILLVGGGAAEDDSAEEELVRFIDFDYSMYFYRGADFGRYFLDCTQTEQFTDREIIPDAEMRQFIEYYRTEATVIYGENWTKNALNSVDAILWEAKLMVLFAYLIDIIFLLRMASFCRNEKKRVMFLTSADRRFGGYLKTKRRFQTEYLKKKVEALT